MDRYLGQYFLINKDKLREIVKALDLEDRDTVIEIGPGHGELTKELRIENRELRGKNRLKIIAVEKDPKLAVSLELLAFRNKLESKIEIIKGDVLKILPELIESYKLKAKSYKIVGNIPYYITGYLLRILGELENKPSLIVLTIQKEVAERICALRQARGKPQMNLLAASVQFWAEPEIIGYISKKDFEPMPKVDSAIIKMMVHPALPYREVPVLKTSKNYSKHYYRLIKILFKQPRKTILNNLRQTTNDPRLLTEKLKVLGIDPKARPQDLSIEQIKELSTLF